MQWRAGTLGRFTKDYAGLSSLLCEVGPKRTRMVKTEVRDACKRSVQRQHAGGALLCISCLGELLSQKSPQQEAVASAFLTNYLPLGTFLSPDKGVLDVEAWRKQ